MAAPFIVIHLLLRLVLLLLVLLLLLLVLLLLTPLLILFMMFGIRYPVDTINIKDLIRIEGDVNVFGCTCSLGVGDDGLPSYA